MKRVTEIPGAYSLEGKSYGPFSATPGEPFKEVPEALALSLGLPEYVGPEGVPTVSADGGAEAEELIQANHSLKADLDEARQQADKLTSERDAALKRADALQATLQEYSEIVKAAVLDRDAAQGRVRELEALLQVTEQQRDEALRLTAEALESGQQLAGQVGNLKTEIERLNITPLMPSREQLLGIKGVGETLADAILALGTPEPAQEPQQ